MSQVRAGKLASLEAENAALKKTIAIIPLVRDAWRPDERLKLTEKCNKCGKPFPKLDESLPQNVRELLEEVKTCADCLEKEMWTLTVKELRKKNAALKSRVAELETALKAVLPIIKLLPNNQYGNNRDAIELCRRAMGGAHK